MNVMYINDCRPQEKKCFTEKYGTNQCILAMRENLMKLYGVSVEESVIDRVIRHGDICATAKGYEALAQLKQRRNGGMV